MFTDKEDGSNVDKNQHIEEEHKQEEHEESSGEKQEKPEQEELRAVYDPVLQTFSNDLILEKITSYLQAPQDRARMQRTSHRLKNFSDNFESNAKTLTIMRIPSPKRNLLKVTYGELTRTVRADQNTTMGSILLDRTLLDRIIQMIPEGEIESIKRVIVRGITSCFKDPFRVRNMIAVTSDFGPFLDNFVGAKHLELSRVDMQSEVVVEEFTSNSTFIKRINSIMLFDLEISIRYFWKLVGENIKKLQLSERMVRYGEYAGLKERGSSIDYVSVLLDDKHWEKQASDQSREYLSTHFHIVPWYLMYERKISFKGNEFVPIKHCKDLRYAQFVKVHREVDTEVIQKTIAQLRHLPYLAKLRIDGYYTLEELEAFAKELKRCKLLESVELRVRIETQNKEDWLKLIEKLPKQLRCVKLDSFSSNEVIIALKDRLSTSLYNLEFRLRGYQFSTSSLKLIYHGFPKLAFLRIYGMRLTLSNIDILKTSNIQAVHFETDHHEKASTLEAAMRQGYNEVSFRYGPGWSMEWNLFKRLNFGAPGERIRPEILLPNDIGAGNLPVRTYRRRI